MRRTTGRTALTATVAVLVATLAALACGLLAGAGAARAASLRYFGYFAARLTQAEGNHLPEVAGRSNLNWVQISDPDKYRPEVLDDCAAAGCIVSTGNEFFRGCTGVHNPDCELYPNYVERWGRLAAAVRSRIDRVGAFYLMDEPQYRGASRAELETAAATIKATYPTIPVLMVEAGPQVTTSYQVPANVDWVGFDWYCQPFTTIEEKLAILSGKINLAQSLYLVAESAPLAACGGAPGHATDAEIAKLQYQYYNLALSNPRVVGLLAFGFWTSGYGSAQLPLTVAAHQAIYNAILAANQPPPPAPPPPPATSPPPSPPRQFHARVVARRALLRPRGRIEVKLGCPARSPHPCRGRLKITRPGDRRRPRLIAAGRFTVAAGTRRGVVVRAARVWRPRLMRLTGHGHRVRLRVALGAGPKATVRLARSNG